MTEIRTVGQITQRAIAEVGKYSVNAKVHTPAQVSALAESIKAYGFNAPIIVDDSGMIIAGHGRLLAAERLGMEFVPCITASHLTPEQVRAYRLVDNKTVSTEWDAGLLVKELDAITAELKLTPQDVGFSSAEVDALMKEIGVTEARGDDFDEDDEEAGDETAESHVHLGDVWQLGEHRLMCGDATHQEDMNKLMDGDVADLVLTDPPYNVNYGDTADRMSKLLGNMRKDSRIENDNMSKGLFVRFLQEAFGVVESHTKSGGGLYCFYGSQSEDAFIRAINESGFKIAQTLVWVKNHFVISMQDYNWQHEPIIYGWKEGAAHYFADWFDESTVIDDRKPKDFRKMARAELQRIAEEMYFKLTKVQTTAIREDKSQKSADHPTKKPVGLCAKLILNSSRHGEIVLDPFGGSGSTLIACDQIGRRARIMELTEKDCNTILRRWERATRKTAELLYRKDGK